jgi:hypothetical protein
LLAKGHVNAKENLEANNRSVFATDPYYSQTEAVFSSFEKALETIFEQLLITLC